MISLDKYGIRLDALTAGTVDGVEVSAAAALSSGARVVCTLTAALPPDAVHLLAASGEMTPEAPTAQFSLYTEPMRRYFLGRRVTETLPARLEFFDLTSQTVLAACTVQVQNSRLLWGDAAAGVPEAQIGLTRADLAQLEREIAEAKATVDEALAAGEETKKYAMAAASAAESARQSAAGSKRVANAAQEAAAAAQEAVNTHSARTDNPHGVTAKQVGAARNDVLIIDDSGTLPNGYTTVTAPGALVFRFSGEYDQSEFTFFIDNFFSASGQNRCRIFQLLLINYSGINRKFTILASGYPVTVSFGYGRRVFTFSVIESDGDVSCNWLGMYNYSNSLVLTDTADATNYQMKVTGGTLSLEEINV